jgi:methionyl-tRNA formyltransferase
MFAEWSARAACDARLIESRDGLTPETLRAFSPRYVFFPHWSWKIPAAIHEEFECVLFHMTDLPYGRGGSPLQNLILRGHKDTMVSAIRVVDGLDAGPVYLKRPLALDGSAQAIYERCARVVFEMIDQIVATEPAPQPQVGKVVTFKRRTPDQSRIPEQADLALVYDYIRMLDAESYPAAFVDDGRHRFEFSEAELSEGEVRARVRITARTSAEGSEA